jgi:hypothetical protein
MASIKVITINTNGTLSYSPLDTDQYTTYLLIGSGSMTSSATVSISGTLAIERQKKFIYLGTFVLDGNDITICGTKLTQEQASGASTTVFCSKPTNGAWNYQMVDSCTIEPRGVDGVEYRVLDQNGGTITLDPATDKKTQYLIGDASTLLAGWAVTFGGSPIDGDAFRVYYAGNLTADSGNSVSINGATLLDSAVYNGGVTIDCEYDAGNTTWRDTQYSQNPLIQTNGLSEVPICVPVSFEANSLGFDHSIVMPWSCIVSQILIQVTSDIAGTDNGSLAFEIDNGAGGVAITGSPVTIPMSSVAGTTITPFVPVSANIVQNAGGAVYINATKTTEGGTVNVYLYLIMTQ